MGSSRDHSYLIERWFIWIGFIYPTIGYYFFLLAADPGTYYQAFSNSQIVWLGITFIAILNSSKSSIWTLRWCLCIVLCAVGSNLFDLFASGANIATVLKYLLYVAAVVIFIYLYGKTVRSVWGKKGSESISSADYFCLVYATLTFFNFIVRVVIGNIVNIFYGSETSIIYINIAAIVCITLANMVPNRREDEINLEVAENSVAIKQAFVRYLSHEMRTPINVALMGVLMHRQYLDERNLLNSECKEVLTDIKDAVDVALETLNEALSYEKLQSNAMALEKTREDPLAFVLSSTNMFKASALNAGVSLILPEAENLRWLENAWVEVDIKKMSQVMRNFMSNALKFAPSGSSITVSMGIAEPPQTESAKEMSIFGGLLDVLPFSKPRKYTDHEPWLELCVKDEGIGIEEEYLPRIFKEVIQINPNKNQDGKGTGMGLVISKGIAELHGGRVEVHSEGLGRGSCFKILLPLHFEKATTPRAAGAAALLTREGAAQVSPLDSDRTEKGPPKESDSLRKAFLSGSITQRAQNTLMRESADHTASLQSVAPFPLTEHLHPIETTALVGRCDTSNDLHTETDYGWTKERLRGQRVLMVDDSPTNLKMCVKLLQRLGAEVDKAEDGRIAVEMVQSMLQRQRNAPQIPHAGLEADSDRQVGYDFVLMDNLMPHMTGVEACRTMRQIGYTGVIFGLTGNAFEQEIAEYLAQGANAVFKKPLVLNDLFCALRRIEAESKA